MPEGVHVDYPLRASFGTHRRLRARAAGAAENGDLMITSLATLNSTDMFTSVVVLSAVGVALVTLVRRVERRLLRWAPEFRA